jgi:hypothetical protein
METILLAPPADWSALPKFMSVRAFCRYSGLDYQAFLKWRKETNFPLHRLGNMKLVEVEKAMAMIQREEPVSAE